MFEVEAKFKIPDVQLYCQQLQEAFGVEFGQPHEESDLFFQHMTRDFRQTDECLRLRVSPNGAFVTYKGPKLDVSTKTREEIELPIGGFASPKQTVRQWQTFFERLGFKAVAKVIKKRRSVSVQRGDTMYQITLDELPCIGFFTEWETMCESEAQIADCRGKLLDCVSVFHLGDSIRKSYLELQSEGF
ncbi:MAG: class IV adenylate cyclase [Thermoguttaceae bacterium]|nr:class IV adenylate cyclase [Thermoguttaceae bacterium]